MLGTHAHTEKGDKVKKTQSLVYKLLSHQVLGPGNRNLSAKTSEITSCFSLFLALGLQLVF